MKKRKKITERVEIVFKFYMNKNSGANRNFENGKKISNMLISKIKT